MSEKPNVTKREANAEFFPDWVPFKNKQGDELGEFVSVPKAKPKKRLAPPVNFILRAVAEPEGDDYYDKGQGESDGEDDYEKKEWSDLNRPAEAVDNNKPLNHTDISDIEGIVNIINNGKPNTDTAIILNALTNNTTNQKQESEVFNESATEEVKEDQKENSKKEEIKEKSEKPVESDKKDKKYEDDVDYEESSSSEKQKPEATEEDQSENDAKKARILDSVDELKERHAEEQRAISEKAKEEEIYKEEHERDKIGNHEEHDKYDIRGRNKKESDYDEYDEKEVSVHEKYKPNHIKTTTTTKKPKKKGRKGKKTEEVGKLSVFKNPQLYMIYDDEAEDTTTTTTKKPTTRSRQKSRFSSRFTTSTPEPEENVRISLVPQDSEAKEGEPTLFFPKTRKNKKRRKNKTTTPEPDSFVAETVKETASKDLATAIGYPSAVSGPSGTGLDGGASKSDTTALGSAPSATDVLSTNSDVVDKVTDAVPASTDHKDEGKKHEDYHNEKGK